MGYLQPKYLLNRNSRKIERILGILLQLISYTINFFIDVQTNCNIYWQQAIREERGKRVDAEDPDGWHVIVTMPSGEHKGRYIKRGSCYQVQALFLQLEIIIEMSYSTDQELTTTCLLKINHHFTAFFFFNFQAVYDWVGAMSTTPIFFTLHSGGKMMRPEDTTEGHGRLHLRKRVSESYSNRESGK